MNNLLLIIFGLLFGFVINFISEWFYLRRKFFPKDLAVQYEEIGIIMFILVPWTWKERLFSHKLRIMLVYIFMAGMAVWLWGDIGDPVKFILKFIVLAYFVLVIVMDVEARVVLHPVSIAGAVIGLVFGWYYRGLLETLIGGAAGFGFMFIVYWLGIKLAAFAAKKRGEKIENEPMGFGDVNLSGVLGLMLGWPGIAAGLFLGIIAGGGFSLILMVQKLVMKKFKMFQTIPYAPFLVIGAAILLFLY